MSSVFGDLNRIRKEFTPNPELLLETEGWPTCAKASDGTPSGLRHPVRNGITYKTGDVGSATPPEAGEAERAK